MNHTIITEPKKKRLKLFQWAPGLVTYAVNFFKQMSLAIQVRDTFKVGYVDIQLLKQKFLLLSPKVVKFKLINGENSSWCSHVM